MTSDVSKMSDEELVERTARRLLGRELVCVNGEWFSSTGKWQPLKDWNHTMMVDHAIAMQPYPIREKFQKALMGDGKWFADVSQRDILEAALLAMEATP